MLSLHFMLTPSFCRSCTGEFGEEAASLAFTDRLWCWLNRQPFSPPGIAWFREMMNSHSQESSGSKDKTDKMVAKRR